MNVNAVVRNEQNGSLYLLGDESALVVNAEGAVRVVTPGVLQQLMDLNPETMRHFWHPKVGIVRYATSPVAID